MEDVDALASEVAEVSADAVAEASAASHVEDVDALTSEVAEVSADAVVEVSAASHVEEAWTR